MKNLKFFLVFFCAIIVQAYSEKADDGILELNKETETSDNFRDLEKRYRLYGKRNYETLDSNEDEDNASSSIEKRYRLYGKRLSDTNHSDLEKRYRLYGKRYRLYGKRYRLYGKRENDQSYESDELKNMMKRYRLIGKGTGKRFRLME